MRYTTTNPKIKIATLLAGCFVCLLMLQQDLSASQNESASSVLALFSNQKRPVPDFDHEKHEDALEDEGCGACHHVFDTEKNRLIYEEGEETACLDCHSNNGQDKILSIQEASHAGCTGCHRTLKKAGNKSGPTTCGECHKK